MFEVLMYLFENYMERGAMTLNTDQDTIISELEQIGFTRGEIGSALEWLQGLNEAQQTVQASNLSTQAIRHYTHNEAERICLEGRGFLLYLQQIGILDPVTREVVIDRLMALEHRDIDMPRIKWVVLIALFNQPDKKLALSLLQDMILSSAFGALQ